MSPFKAAMQIARWEFLRYVKLKQQIIGMLITFGAGAAVIGVMRISERGDTQPITVAYIGSDILAVPATGPGYALDARPANDEAALRDAIGAGALGALLIVRDRDHAELVIRKRGPWVDALQAAVTGVRQQVVMQELSLEPAHVAAVMTPPEFDVTVQRKAGSTDNRLSKLTLGIVIGLMLFCVFMGMNYIFASITGEKQIRVTEQIISAIPAQSWIDGKILGLIAVSLVTVLNTTIASGALVAAMVMMGPGINIQFQPGAPLVVLTVILFGVLGLFFWFAFLSAVAAMIDDPYNSSRGSLLMVPVFATALAFFVAKDPYGFGRLLSLFPATSPSAMPARMIVSDVPTWEVILSLLLLAGGVALLRIAAGRIFRLGMLMYGKEPTWSEVKRWALSPR